MQSDSGFTGKLTSPAGTMDWSGSLRDGALAGLNIAGNSPFAGLSLDLTQSGSDTMIRGPLSVKYGSETFRANVGLEMSHEKFGIIFDSLQEDLPVHFDLISSVKVTPSKSTVSPPKSTKNLQDLLDAIDALTPTMMPTLEDTVGTQDEMLVTPQNN